MSWFAGPHEGHPDTGIQVLRRADGEDTVVDLVPGDDQPHWNPVLTWGPDGAVWLFFKRGHRIDEWTTWVSVSPDDGRTWQEPFELVAGDRSGGRGPVRQAPIRVGQTWLAAGSIEEWATPAWDCFVDLSTDDGHSWRQVVVPLDHAATAGAGCIQPWVVPGTETALVMLARSTAGAVFRAVTDDPAVWPELRPTSLPNNNSGIAVVALPGGALICVHNDAAGDWGARSRLVVSRSDDDGLTWRQVAVLEERHPRRGRRRARRGRRHRDRHHRRRRVLVPVRRGARRRAVGHLLVAAPLHRTGPAASRRAGLIERRDARGPAVHIFVGAAHYRWLRR